MRWHFALVLAASCLAACALVLDFDGYRGPVADENVVEAGASDAEVAPDFELIVPEMFTLHPDGKTTLPVAIVQTAGAPQRVVITIDLKNSTKGLSWAADGAIEPGNSRTAVSFALGSDPPLDLFSFDVVAISGAVVRRKTVLATVRGVSCSIDASFGKTGYIAVPFDGKNAFAADTSAATLGIAANAKEPELWAIIEDTPIWHRPLPVTAASISGDGAGGFVVGSPEGLRHVLADGGDDESFGLVTTSCSGKLLARTDTGFVTLCSSGGGSVWALMLVAPSGKTTPLEALFGSQDSAYALGLSTTSEQITGCGYVNRGQFAHAAAARWYLDGGLDPSFGVAGRLVRDDRSGFFTCIASSTRVVALGTYGGQAALFGMARSGESDTSFGDAGVALLPAEADSEPLTTLAAFDNERVVVAAGRAPVLYRYTRTGQLDPTFGIGGSCNLDELGIGTPIAIFNADHDRLLLVSGRNDGSHVIARMWL